MLRLSQAQPRQSEENEGGKGHERYPEAVRPRKQTHQGVREKRVRFDDPSSAPASASDAAEDDGIQSKRTRGKDTRGRKFFVTEKDVEIFGPTARCPACADTAEGISGRHAHNDECRDRVGKLSMDEGAQRVESYFGRARVREQTGSGGTATSSGSGTVVTHAQTPKRKADDETVETDERSKKRQTERSHPCRRCMSGDLAVQEAMDTVSAPRQQQRVVVPPEVPQDTRTSIIEDMEISQLKVKREIKRSES